MSWLGTAAKAAGTAAILTNPIGLAGSGVRVVTGKGIDPTPGYSATNNLRQATGGKAATPKKPTTYLPNSFSHLSTVPTGSASSGPSYQIGYNDPATLSAYSQGISNTQAAIDRLGRQQNSGYSGIDASYTNALNQLLLGKNQANKQYDTTKQQTATDYVGGKNTIRSNAGNSLNGLLRLLGSRGAGGSSAATITAPGAVARQATLQQTGLGSTFAQNNQALDTNWGNYMTGYGNEVNSAKTQREQERQSLEQNISSNRATLLQTLAGLVGQKAAATGGNPSGAAAPYLARANSVLDSISNYRVKPIAYKTQAYNAPSLGSYTVDPNAAPTYQGQGQTNDYTSPYLAALLKKQQPAFAGG